MNTEIKSESEWSSKNKQPSKLQWQLHNTFLFISYPLLVIGSSIMKLSNILMFDTHHLEINLTPKEYDY